MPVNLYFVKVFTHLCCNVSRLFFIRVIHTNANKLTDSKAKVLMCMCGFLRFYICIVLRVVCPTVKDGILLKLRIFDNSFEVNICHLPKTCQKYCQPNLTWVNCFEYIFKGQLLEYKHATLALRSANLSNIGQLRPVSISLKSHLPYLTQDGGHIFNWDMSEITLRKINIISC